MAGRKPLHENELERRIRESYWLRNLGYCNQAIGRELCLSSVLISVYLQGYSSKKKYKEELERKTKEYETRLSELKPNIPLIRYKIIELKKTTRGLVIGLESSGFISSEVRADFEESVEEILKECPLGESRIRVSSRENKISMTCYGIDARAFVNAYAEVILSREKNIIKK